MALPPLETLLTWGFSSLTGCSTWNVTGEVLIRLFHVEQAQDSRRGNPSVGGPMRVRSARFEDGSTL